MEINKEVNMTSKELKIEAVEVRKLLMNVIYKAQSGHTGGDLSCVEIITALYNGIMNINPKDPQDPDRDRFVLSKGHSVEVYYAVLARRGFFPFEELDTYAKAGSRLIGHPTNKVPGIEMNTGALGHGLSISVGMAIGLKKSGRKSRVFCLMGDGEQAEGSIWEAVMAAGFYKLDNLVAILDRNRLQISGNTEDVMALEPIAEKYRSFGWNVAEINGNSMEEVVDVLSRDYTDTKPLMIIAHTIKGKGIHEIENVVAWHHAVPSAELMESAARQFEAQEEEIENE
jgi:transketolase